MRIHSLRVRWMLMFMAVVIVALGIFAMSASQILRDALQRYQANQQANDQQLITQIQASYNRSQSTQQTQSQAEQIAARTRVRIIVIDHNQQIIADSDHILKGQAFTTSLLLALDKSSNVSIGAPIFLGDWHASSHAVRIISTDGRMMTVGQPVATANAIIGPVDHGLTRLVCLLRRCLRPVRDWLCVDVSDRQGKCERNRSEGNSLHARLLSVATTER